MFETIKEIADDSGLTYKYGPDRDIVLIGEKNDDISLTSLDRKLEYLILEEFRRVQVNLPPKDILCGFYDVQHTPGEFVVLINGRNYANVLPEFQSGGWCTLVRATLNPRTMVVSFRIKVDDRLIETFRKLIGYRVTLQKLLQKMKGGEQ